MAEAKLSRLRELAVQVESTKGTAEALPTDGSNSKFRIYDLRLVSEIGIFDRNIQKNHLDMLNSLTGIRAMRVQFSLELRSTEAAGTADTWGDLLQACGFKETVNASTSVVYTPSSVQSEHETVSLTVYIDGYEVHVKGCSGNVVFRGRVGEPAFMDFDFLGIYSSSDETESLHSVTHETGAPEIFHGVSLDINGSTSHVIGSWTLDMGNEVVLREDVNDSGGALAAIITGRNPTGTVDPEVDNTQDWHDLLVAGTELTTISLNAHSSIAIALPAPQITSVEDSERNGVAIFNLAYAARADSDDTGDDSVSITKT